MAVKIVVLLVLLVVLVGGVAVSGSRAQPLPQVSVAFSQCANQRSRSTGSCRPLIAPMAVGRDEGADEADAGGVDAADANEAGANEADAGEAGGDDSPDRWMEFLAAGLRAVAAVLDLMARAGIVVGSPAELPAPVTVTIFDPAQ
jgi:hypothetical protein